MFVTVVMTADAGDGWLISECTGAELLDSDESSVVWVSYCVRARQWS